LNRLIITLGLFLFIAPTFAHENKNEGLISLQASASKEVQTDTMEAVISVEVEKLDPSRVAEIINKEMSFAIKTASTYKNITVKGGQYTTHQVYDKRIFKAWRGAQSITLKSKDIHQLGQLIGVLQKKFLIKSLVYNVSPEKRKQYSAKLLEQAIVNFKEKSALITKNFGKNNYVIHQININSNNRQPVYYAKSRMMSDSNAHMNTPASLQQTQVKIEVNINGSIRLIN